MNERPAISVIVAVYKAESYLRKCLDSLRAQTFQDFEVLLVDDGSPDHSGAICDEYATTDSRFRVFHKENGGVSSARQCGIDHARGEYTIHADPDDWVEPDMLAQLYAKAKAEDADMVICDYYVDARGNSRRIVQRPSALDHETVLRELFQQLHGSCCNKLVKRACYSEYRVAFPLELSFCEDLYVNAALLCHDLRIAYLPQAFYHYVQLENANSLVRTYTPKAFDHDVKMYRLFQALLADTPAREESATDMSYLVVSRAFYGHCFSSHDFKEKCAPYAARALQYLGNRATLYPYLKAACAGYYRLAYNLFRALRRIKHFIKK